MDWFLHRFDEEMEHFLPEPRVVTEEDIDTREKRKNEEFDASHVYWDSDGDGGEGEDDGDARGDEKRVKRE